VTLIIIIAIVLARGFALPPRDGGATDRRKSERFALAMLIGGVAVSAGLFFGLKNRPGAYQGSPSAFMDPNAHEEGFRLDRIPVPTGPAAVPENPDAVRAVLTGYAQAFQRLLAGYYILDRNYNYDFHNHLFLRSTPLLANYRAVGLQKVHEAEALRADADRELTSAGPIPADVPLGALVADVHDYAAFAFGRSPTLEQMSASFEQTQAGLQHATHLYEGEGKVFSAHLGDLLQKHHAVLASPSLTPITSEFVSISHAVYEAYLNRIVGF
jgi:hypothetical protein